MIGWVHPRLDHAGSKIPHEYVATRLPADYEFEAFIRESMRSHRLLRIIGEFEGAFNIAVLMYRLAPKYIPLQFNVICTHNKEQSIELSWIEAFDMEHKYIDSE